VKKVMGVLCLLALASAVTLAAPNVQSSAQPFPKTLINARYVYVTSYDGGEFNPNVFPEDRQAIADVQTAMHDWGRYIVVYHPRQADMIVAVQKRGSEDVLAVYDPHLGAESTYLWRAMGRGGLDRNEMPLFDDLRQAVEKAAK